MKPLAAEVERVTEENKTLAAAVVAAEGPSYVFMQAEVDRLRKEHTGLHKSFDQAIADNDRLRSQLDELMEANRKLAAKERAALREVERLTAENHARFHEIERLQRHHGEQHAVVGPLAADETER